MERPVISCDVSKGRSHIQGYIGLSNLARSSVDIVFLKDCVFILCLTLSHLPACDYKLSKNMHIL